MELITLDVDNGGSGGALDLVALTEVEHNKMISYIRCCTSGPEPQQEATRRPSPSGTPQPQAEIR
jgi:hypothetical protein